jgi:hypothetical protein
MPNCILINLINGFQTIITLSLWIFQNLKTQILFHYLLFVDHEHMNYEIFQRHFSTSMMGNVSWPEN